MFRSESALLIGMACPRGSQHPHTRVPMEESSYLVSIRLVRQDLGALYALGAAWPRRVFLIRVQKDPSEGPPASGTCDAVV